jgi:hypothetical protein
MDGAPGDWWVQLRIMPKRLASKYWPMILLVISIIAILCLSRYARGGMTSWVETLAWPNGVSVCALLLTLVVIAWQSTEARDAAQTSRDSIRLQELALRQWVDLVNWQMDYVPSKTGQPAFLKITVDVVNPTGLPLVIHKGRIVFGGNTTFFLPDEFIMTPRNPYTVDLSLYLTDKQESDFLRIGYWFPVRGEMPHVGTLGKLQPQPICGHLTCLNGKLPMWHPEMPAEAEDKKGKQAN